MGAAIPRVPRARSEPASQPAAVDTGRARLRCTTLGSTVTGTPWSGRACDWRTRGALPGRERTSVPGHRSWLGSAAHTVQRCPARSTATTRTPARAPSTACLFAPSGSWFGPPCINLGQQHGKRGGGPSRRGSVLAESPGLVVRSVQLDPNRPRAGLGAAPQLCRPWLMGAAAGNAHEVRFPPTSGQLRLGALRPVSGSRAHPADDRDGRRAELAGFGRLLPLRAHLGHSCCAVGFPKADLAC